MQVITKENLHVHFLDFFCKKQQKIVRIRALQLVFALNYTIY